MAAIGHCFISLAHPPSFTPNGTARRDDTRVLRVSVYNHAFTLKGFSPEIVLGNEARASNAQLYGYRHDRAEIRFGLQVQNVHYCNAMTQPAP